jgi:hypothetical protein
LWKIDEAQTLRLMNSGDPCVQAWIVRMLGDIGGASKEQIAVIRKLGQEGAPDVKLQVAIASRKIDGLDPLPVLVEILAGAGDDKLIPHIVWQNLHPLLATQSDAFLAEVKKYDLKATPSLAKIMPRAVERIAAAKK